MTVAAAPIRLADAADRLSGFALDAGRTALPAAPEPVLGSGPMFVEFDDSRGPERRRLDPARAFAEPQKPPAASGGRRRPLALAASLGIHLLPLLLLLNWTAAPARIPPPIPVTLVMQRPPPPPPVPPAEKRRPPPGRLASEEMGEKSPPKPEAAAPPRPTPPPEPKLAAVTPPKPIPPPAFETALPKPKPAAEAAALPAIEKPAPPYKEAPVKHPVVARLPPRREAAPHAAQFPGPAATRDEYLAYCSALIRRYGGMMSPALLAGRSGMATLAVQVLDDGTIARVSVKQSSGYRDIDETAERMVAAVRRFPPLPQWFQGSRIQLDYHLAFRDGAISR